MDDPKQWGLERVFDSGNANMPREMHQIVGLHDGVCFHCCAASKTSERYLDSLDWPSVCNSTDNTSRACSHIMLYNDFCRSSFAHKKKTLIFVILLFLEIVFMESLRNILGAKAQQSVDITISWYCEKGRNTYLCWRISFSRHCTWHEDTFPGLGWTCTSANWWRDWHPAWNQCPLPRQDSQRSSGPGEKETWRLFWKLPSTRIEKPWSNQTPIEWRVLSDLFFESSRGKSSGAMNNPLSSPPPPPPPPPPSNPGSQKVP